MRRLSIAVGFAIVTVAACGVAVAAGIVSGPQVSRTANGWQIAFAVDAPTDVTVRIFDGEGNVVRHLACGMVGLKRAAAPFTAGTLSQKIAWDGKNDAGEPVAAKGCRAFVGVGLQVKFDRFILSAGDGFVMDERNPRDMIFKGRGEEYYVAQCFGIHADTIRVFNGEGHFLRALFPYALGNPGTLEFLDTRPEEFGPARGPVRHDAVDWDGDRVPVSVAHSDSYYLTPRVAQAVVTPRGYIVATLGYVAGYASFTVWNPQGFPVEHFAPVPWHVGISAPADVPEDVRKAWRSKDNWKIVATKEGEIYLADKTHHVVARLRGRDLAPLDFVFSGNRKLGAPHPYIGEMNVPGDDPDHFTGPDGIAVNASGNLLVLDGKVVKGYDVEGRFISSEPRADSDFDRFRVPIRDGGLNWGQILKMEKAKPGSSGVPAKVIAAGKKPGTIAFPHFISVDSTGRLCLLERGGTPWLVSDVNGKKVEPRQIGSPGLGYMCVGPDDNWYVSVQPGYSTKAELWKFSPDGQRLKFGEKDAIIPDDVGQRGNIKGVFATRTGDIYLVAAYRDVPQAALKEAWPKGEASLLCRVDVYSPAGERKKKGLVRGRALSDVAVDREGNVYTIEGKLRYKGRPQPTWPPPFLPPDEAKGYQGDQHVNQRKSLMQRLVKYGPAGGVVDGEGEHAQLWDHPGVSGVSPLAGWGHLQPGQMHLDADERIWIPDTYNYCIKAVDKAGNLVLRVGKYGSEDCRGGGGDLKLDETNIVIDPEIPLARPHGMAIYKDFLLIPDMFAHRVVRCRLNYVDQKTTPLPE